MFVRSELLMTVAMNTADFCDATLFTALLS